MAENIDIDLKQDFANLCRDLLVELGYKSEEIAEIAHDENAIRALLGVRRRFVPPQRRSIAKSKGFFCPPEFVQGLAEIEEKIESGDDLAPHLSRRLVNPHYKDDLLNHWGLHHLHLGTSIESDGFVQRTKHLLFCRFEDENAYFIDVLPHEGAWTLQRLVEEIHDNWPDTIRRHRFQNGTADFLSDTHVKVLRSKNTNHCVSVRDGTVYLPLGGGVTSSGDNVIDIAQADYWLECVGKQQEEIIKDFPNIKERARSRGIMFPEIARFELTMLGDTFCATETSSNYILYLRI